jgi:ketosteroid isomerase-like protein
VAECATRETVRDLYDAYARRDFERFAALLHDDIDWMICAPVTVFPFAGPRHGRAAVLQAMGGIAEQYAVESYKPEIVLVDGERAAVLSDTSFRQRATDRVIRLRLANFLRFQDGRLIGFREYLNSFDAVAQALGRSLTL